MPCLESKFLADLSAIGGEELVKDHLPYVQAYGRSSDGKLRAVSDNSSPGGFWYLRDNAKKWLGTDNPDEISAMVDSWEKVIALGKKIKRDSIGKVHLIQSASGLFDIMAYNTEPWVKEGKLNVDPKWKQTYETQLKIRAEGVDAKLGFMSSGWGSALNDGSVVLTSMPSWASFMIDNKDGNANGKFGVAKTPQGWFLGGRYEGIYEKSPNKELAYEVLKFIAAPEWQKFNLEQTGNMPSNELVFDQNARAPIQNCRSIDRTKKLGGAKPRQAFCLFSLPAQQPFIMPSVRVAGVVVMVMVGVGIMMRVVIMRRRIGTAHDGMRIVRDHSGDVRNRHHVDGGNHVRGFFDGLHFSNPSFPDSFYR
jgi:hypothetical protein